MKAPRVDEGGQKQNKKKRKLHLLVKQTKNGQGKNEEENDINTTELMQTVENKKRERNIFLVPALSTAF
jgi:hypothetical protein